MEVLKPVVSAVITEKCYENYLVDFNFFDAACFKTVLSKGLGYGIVAGSMMVKLPQIQKIVAAKSGQGISFLSTLMELVVYTATFAYCYAKEFPFSSYGDSIFVMFQTLAIGFLYLIYAGQLTNAYTFIFTFLAVLYALVSGLTPINVLATMQMFNIPITVTAKSIQIWSNYSASSTGQLSLITTMLLFLGSTARIFTSIQETGDVIIISSYVIGCVMNAVVLAQIFYYWDSSKDKQKTQ